MKITLINPSLMRQDELRWDKGGTYPPLGLCYIAAVLRNNKHEVNIIDGEALRITGEKLKERLLKDRPQVIGITSHTPKFNQLLDTIKTIKELNLQAAIVVGGPHISLIPEKTMKQIPQIAYAVIGEGEYTFLELVNSIENKQPIEKVNGIAYRQGDKIILTSPRDYIKNLDELPLPARDLLPNIAGECYSNAFRYKQLPMTSVITSRGCPYACIFCARIFGARYRMHSFDKVMEEIRHLVKNYGIKEIIFVDDTFIVDIERTIKICNALKEQKLGLTWSCHGRIDILYKHPELIPLMKNSGCWYISLGIESGNAEVLKKIRKNITLEQVDSVVNQLNSAGIHTKGFFMIGHPYDTKESIRDTIDFAKSLPLGSVQFSYTIPYPGTELFDIAINHGFFEGDSYEKMSSHTAGFPVYSPPGVPIEYLKAIQKKAYREFYFRPSFLLKHLVKINSFQSLKKYSERGFVYFKSLFLKK
ncbi:MAG: B12-binding domain-containing radical SAM protein [Elusimicrobia bacterium]|nr:B12-binding domain-containing radical SAM protein [Candidatus Liberimonas magnetica]